MTVLHKKTKVAIADIRLDGGTQQRIGGLNESKVSDYVEKMGRGVRFPPVTLFYDGTTYWLADGFHRVAAVRRRPRRRKIDAEVRQGGLRDAILHSVGANEEHGLPRSNADKRNAVETLLKDPEWSQWSDREIARKCSVSDRFVNKNRAILTANGSQLETPPTDRTYTTKHGTQATMNTARIGGAQTTASALTPPPDPRPVPAVPPAPAAPAAAPTPTPACSAPTAALPFYLPPRPVSVPATVYADIEDIDLAQTLLSALRVVHNDQKSNTGGYQQYADWWAVTPPAVRKALTLWGAMGYPGLPPSPEAVDDAFDPLPLPPVKLDAPLPDLIDIEEIVDPEMFDLIDATSSQGLLDQGRCTAPTHLGGMLDGRYRGVNWIHVGGEYGDDSGTIWLWEVLKPEAWGDQCVLTIHKLLHAWRDGSRDPWDFRGLRLQGGWNGGMILGARRLRLHCPSGLRRAGEPEIPDRDLQWLDWRNYNGKSCEQIEEYTFYSLSQGTLARLWRRLQPRHEDWQDTPANRGILAMAVFCRIWILADSSPIKIDTCRYFNRRKQSGGQ